MSWNRAIITHNTRCCGLIDASVGQLDGLRWWEVFSGETWSDPIPKRGSDNGIHIDNQGICEACEGKVRAAARALYDDVLGHVVWSRQGSPVGVRAMIWMSRGGVEL